MSRKEVVKTMTAYFPLKALLRKSELLAMLVSMIVLGIVLTFFYSDNQTLPYMELLSNKVRLRSRASASASADSSFSSSSSENEDSRGGTGFLDRDQGRSLNGDFESLLAVANNQGRGDRVPKELFVQGIFRLKDGTSLVNPKPESGVKRRDGGGGGMARMMGEGGDREGSGEGEREGGGEGNHVNSSLLRHARTECPDVLRLMLKGRWRQDPMTNKQRNEMRAFHKLTNRRGFGLPLHLQREDKLCGNLSHLPPNNKWRALCDPDGPTPCCRDNVCTNSSAGDCDCDGCFDLRTLIFAEYATWIPEDDRCRPVKMTVSETCRLLDGAVIAFVGDSLIRHLYIAFLMAVRGDENYGALRPKAAKTHSSLRKRCRGKYMFPGNIGCTGKIDKDANLCNGRVTAKFISYYHPDGGSPPEMVREVQELQKVEKSLAVIGFGSHYNFDSRRTKYTSLLPLLQKVVGGGVGGRKSPNRPRLLWAAIHAKDRLKKPLTTNHTTTYISNFNADIEVVLRAWNVPVFDTFNMTSQWLWTLDGNHFGLGVNRAKVQVLLNYLLELRARRQW